MAVMKEPLGGHQDISEEPLGEKKKKHSFEANGYKQKCWEQSLIQR
jgi:hypothetical protein